MTRCMLMLLLALGYGVANAQQVNVYGSVVDANTKEPLVGVSIVIVGTTQGTTTDLDGKFVLSLEPGSYSFTASYVGYLANTRSNVIIQSKGNDDLNFQLKEGGEELEAVVITANPFQKSQVSPLSLQTLSPEEIKTYPGGNNDIAKVVQSLPGVAGSIGGFRNDVIIRGGAPNENVYYLDGIEIPNINHFSTQGSAGGPVGMLNVDFIEEVELSSSAFGARYDNPLSGVLQFNQREGNKRERQTNLRVSASETALTTEGPLFKKDRQESNTSYILSVRRSYLQLLFQLLDLPIRPDYWDYQYKVSHRLDERNNLFLTGIGSIDDFSVEAPSDFSPEQQAILEQVPIIRQWTTTAGLGWRHRLREGKGIMNTYLSTNILNNEFSRFMDNENEEGLVLKNISRETEQKLRYEYTRFVRGWTITTGANLIRSVYTNETENVSRNLSFSTNLDFIRYGLFMQANKALFDERMILSAGLRIDDHTYGESSQLLNTFSPRLSISYDIDAKGNWKANGSIGQYYKLAPFTVLGYQDESGTLVNQNVPYIGSFHGVLGVERRVGDFGKLSVEGFYKYYTDYPVSLIDSVSLANKGADFSVLGNEAVISEGEGRSYGVELLYQQKLAKNFYAILAYTLFKSEFTNLDGDYLPSAWDSRHLISFTGGYKIKGNWEISCRYRFAGETPYAPVNTDASLTTYPALVLDYDGLANARLGTFSQLDLRIDKKWNFKALALNLFLDVQNVLAQQIPEPPQFGLARDAEGAVLNPARLSQINTGASAVLPTIGLAIDF